MMGSANMLTAAIRTGKAPWGVSPLFDRVGTAPGVDNFVGGINPKDARGDAHAVK
jgi:hypothetical protein